jgi:hypothetical protein
VGRIGNRIVAAVLRSPFHRMLSGSLLLLTVRGRRSGRTHTLPVQYAREGETLWIYPGHHERKVWWRNLLEPAAVSVLLAGEERAGTGQALLAERDPDAVAAGTRAYLARFPKLARTAHGEIVVRVELERR